MEGINIKKGAKLYMSVEGVSKSDKDFDVLTSFNKAEGDAYFYVSIPLKNGKALKITDSTKILVKYMVEDVPMIMTTYCDDIVKEGVRSFWKLRKVSEQRAFFERNDQRYKVALHLQYLHESWSLNFEGEIDREEALSLDVSAGGIAMYMGVRFDVGEVVKLFFPRIGTNPDGAAVDDIAGVVCWTREAPIGSPHRHVCGLQFRLTDEEKEKIRKYIDNMKRVYKL